MPSDTELVTFAKELTDRGKLVEAGWVGFRIAVVSKDAPQVQLDEMQTAFFAGAQHLFAAIMGILEPGEEPTDADLGRMSLINRELEEFATAFERRIGGRG